MIMSSRRCWKVWARGCGASRRPSRPSAALTIRTSTATIMNIDAALYRLMTWLSPSYPLGAFSYSHGLEYAVEAGFVHDRASFSDWIASAVTAGAGRSDGALLAAAWRAASEADRATLETIVELAGAWRGTAETALESRAQGAAFLATTRAAWRSEERRVGKECRSR